MSRPKKSCEFESHHRHQPSLAAKQERRLPRRSLAKAGYRRHPDTDAASYGSASQLDLKRNESEAGAAAERLCVENPVSEAFRLFFFAAGFKYAACK